MRLGRLRQDIVVRLGTADVSAVVEAVRMRKKEEFRSSRLWVRVKDDGRIRARLLIGGRYHTRPHMKGRVVAGDQGAAVQGVVYESYLESLYSSVYVGLAVLMAAVSVVILVASGFGNPGLYVCGVSAAAFGWLASRLARLRPPGFTRDAAELKKAISRLVRPTNGRVNRWSTPG
jgi:hypothetical protein